MPGNRCLDVDEQRRIGAVEAVDRLRRVADEEQVVSPGAEDVDQLVLERVEVLGFVDEDVAESPPQRVGEVAVASEFTDRVRQHVVEVDDASPPLQRLVSLERGGAPLDARRRTAL